MHRQVTRISRQYGGGVRRRHRPAKVPNTAGTRLQGAVPATRPVGLRQGEASWPAERFPVSAPCAKGTATLLWTATESRDQSRQRQDRSDKATWHGTLYRCGFPWQSASKRIRLPFAPASSDHQTFLQVLQTIRFDTCPSSTGPTRLVDGCGTWPVFCGGTGCRAA